MGKLGQDLVVAMKDEGLRKALGARIKALRKSRSWTQKELAAKLGVRSTHLNKYESGYHVPPVEKLIRLADLFETTLDFLARGEAPNEQSLRNQKLVSRLRDLESLGESEQNTVLQLLDAIIVKHKVEGAIRSVE